MIQRINAIAFILVLMIPICASAKIVIDPKMQLSESLNQNGSIMAIVVGPDKKKPSDTENCYVFLVNLNTLKYIKVPDSERVLPIGMSWRNKKENDELYMTRIDYNTSNVYSMLAINEKGKVVFSQNETQNIISRSFRWSPNGKVLVGSCISEPGESFTDGYLGISYSNEKKTRVFKEYPCDPFVPPVWINNNQFYIYDSFFVPDDDGDSLFKTIGQIYQVSIINKKKIETKKVFEGEKVKLYGTINGKCVYRHADKIVIGSKPIYSSKIMGVIISGERIAVESSDKSEFVVIDPDGNIVFRERRNDNQHLYAFSADAGKLFILENKKTIYQWNLKGKLEAKTIFNISELQ